LQVAAHGPAAIAVPAHPAARLLAALEGALAWAAGLILLVLLTLVGAAVVQRYVFGSAFLGSDEAAIWLNVALVAAGSPLVAGSALAMRFDLLTRALSPAGQAVAEAVAAGVTVFAGLALCMGGIGVAAEVGGVSTSLNLPEWWRYAAIAVGGGLTLLTCGLRLLAERGAAMALCGLGVGMAAHAFVAWGFVPLAMPASAVAGIVAVLAMLAGAPLPHAFLAAAVLTVPFGGPMPEAAVVQTAVAGVSKFLLLAIPFFLLAGNLLMRSGLAGHLVRFSQAMVGHRRGGLAQTTLVTSTLFSGVSGSSVANAAFGATTFGRELVQRGYSPPQAAGLIAATSTLDNVIPPSIAFLLLATATGLSVGGLMFGGLWAGLLMVAALAISFHLTSREPASGRAAPAAERWRSTWGALPAFGLCLVVVLGIRYGVVTTTEAAALAALYTLGAGLFARQLRGVDLARAFRESATEAAVIGLLIGSAAPFAFLLAVDGVADWVAGLAAVIGHNPFLVLLIVNLMLLVAGCVLDIGAAILLLGPILLPMVTAAGVDPVTFGVILVVNLMIGGITPPVGMLVFVAAGVMRQSPLPVFRAVLPHLLALLTALACLSAFAAMRAGG
jgi:tripartite ATP-independent transporter DctM subunit